MQVINVGVLGFGTIGTGVAKMLLHNADIIEQRLGAKLHLARMVDRQFDTPRDISLPSDICSTDVASVLDSSDIDLVVELIGGYEPAREFVLRAIAHGKHVVTANKALLAVHGPEIYQAAAANGVQVYFEAAVAGGIPVLSSIKENLCANRFSHVYGILNGTCNYILSRMSQEGAAYEDVLADAQAQGYAEADPGFDVEGTDAAHKLALLVSLCFGTEVPFEQIYTEGITAISSLDICFAQQFGYEIKLLAIGKLVAGHVEARVHPTMVPQGYPLAEIDGVLNAVRLVGDYVGPVMLVGAGAGMEATASAVVGDLMAAARNICPSGALPRTPLGYGGQLSHLPLGSREEIVTPYYLRFTVPDRPGVLAQISGVLGRYDISIASMLQPERQAERAVPVVLMTHEAREADICAALEEIASLDLLQEPSRYIRIEADLG